MITFGGASPLEPANSDPYGLLTDPAAVQVDEFDDATIGADWVEVTPGSGAITWGEGNHMMTASVLNATTGNGGGMLIPFTSLGGAWDSVTVVECTMRSTLSNSEGRCNFVVTDGTTTTSTALGYHYNFSANQQFMVKGTVQHAYTTAFTGIGAPSSSPIRVRLVSTSSGSKAKILLSTNGVTWLDMTDVDAASEYTLGFTPTHVGFTLQGNVFGFESDYLRRIA